MILSVQVKPSLFKVLINANTHSRLIQHHLRSGPLNEDRAHRLCGPLFRKDCPIPTPSFTFGAMLATLYGALFHVWQGGNGRRLTAYLLATWLGFGLGQLVAELLNIAILNVGPVHVLSGTLGSWVGLIVTRSLVPRTRPSSPRQ